MAGYYPLFFLLKNALSYFFRLRILQQPSGSPALLFLATVFP